jgi:hypothetical protein
MASEGSTEPQRRVAVWREQQLRGHVRLCAPFTPLGHPEHPADRRAQQRDGVHGRHRVIQRGGVQHPAHPHQPSLAGRSHGDRKDPLRPRRGRQPGPHVHQDRVTEAGVVERQPAAGVLPAGIETKRLDRFAVRQALQALQHQHRGHNPRWHAAPPDPGEQVSEQLVAKQPVTLVVQHRPNRLLADAALAHRRRATPQVGLLGGRPSGHRPLPVENHIHVILDRSRINQRTRAREKHQPPSEASLRPPSSEPPSSGRIHSGTAVCQTDRRRSLRRGPIGLPTGWPLRKWLVRRRVC